MASPILAALRARFEDAEITFLCRRYAREIVAGCAWHDAELYWPEGKGVGRDVRLVGLGREIRRRRFDLALLLTNSFRSALAVYLGGVPRRIGYARDGRSWMLTDRLCPLKLRGEYVPAPMLPYYAALAERAGCEVTDFRLRLGVTEQQETAGAALQQHYKLTPKRYAVINVGAAFGAAKCWLPERFAEVAMRLRRELDLQPVIVGATNEAALMRTIADRADAEVTVCYNPGTTLGSLKPLVRDAAALVCNDTGPRHYGLAFDVPTVCIFGPTFQEWTDSHHPLEIKLQALVECGPCQLKKCPLDLECMRLVTADMVMAAVAQVMQRSSSGAAV